MPFLANTLSLLGIPLQRKYQIWTHFVRHSFNPSINQSFCRLLLPDVREENNIMLFFIFIKKIGIVIYPVNKTNKISI